MALYVCDNEDCHAIENTALGAYWGRQPAGLPILCSECGPDGAWHGMFEKRVATADEVMRRRAEFRGGDGLDAVLANKTEAA